MASSGQLINYATLASDTALWNDTGNLENPGSSGKSYLSIAPYQYFYISTDSTPFLGTEPKIQLLVNDATWTSTGRTEGYNWRQINDVTIGKSKEQVHQTNWADGATYQYNVGPGIVLWRPKRLQGNSDRTHFRFANAGLYRCGESYYNTWWKGQPICGFAASYLYLGDTWTVDSPGVYLQSSSGFARIPSGTLIGSQYARCVYPLMPWM